MAKEERLFDAKQGAYMTRMALASFRTKVSKLGIKGQRQGVKVFYTRKQLENLYSGVPAKKKPGRKPIEKVAKKAKPKKVAKRPVKKVSKKRA